MSLILQVGLMIAYKHETAGSQNVLTSYCKDIYIYIYIPLVFFTKSDWPHQLWDWVMDN